MRIEDDKNKLNDPIAGLTPEKKRELLAQLLRQFHALSFGQRALWLLHRWAPQSAAYNLMFALRTGPGLDVGALERAFQQLSDRHPTLRTTYLERNGEPVQRVHPQYRVHFRVIDAAAWDPDLLNRHLSGEADRPFDLEQGPIFRVNLFTRPAGEHVLLMTLHHIAVDFLSLDLMAGELHQLYLAESTGSAAGLAPLNLQYTDFVHWQMKMLAGADGEKLWHYWQRQLAGELPVLNLPTDHPRPTLQTFCGAAHEFELAEATVSQLKKLANSRGMTLYMIIAAVFMTLLHRYTGQDDILLGSPLLGRGRPEWEHTIGYFANPVVYRGDLGGDPLFTGFMDQVRGVILDAVEHQDYPFPLLVERLQLKRDPGRSPLFQAALFWDKILQAQPGATPQVPDFEPLVMRQRGAPFDLVLSFIEAGPSLTGVWQYNTDLFETGTATRMIEHFQVLSTGIAADPQRPISQLPILSTAERNRLLLEWNDSGAVYPVDLCIHELFEIQVERHPWAAAAVFGDRHVTYSELERRANRLAHYLSGLGAGPETMAGICLARSLDMIESVLGILKAGGAYLPLDPAFPRGRLTFMLQDSGAPVLLTTSPIHDKLPKTHAQTVYLDTHRETILLQSDKKNNYGGHSTDMAYTIYTSGSTGKPRGVPVTHRAVVNFLSAMVHQPGMVDRDRLLAVTTLSFDIAALEIFLPLSVGACCVLAGQETVTDGIRLLKKLERANITVMQATPATWRLLLEAGWNGNDDLKVLCGGETLPRGLADRLLEKCASLWNLYGPTETTIWSTVHRVEQMPAPVPIGRPVANTRVYLLDSHFELTPTGVPGEMYIGGDGLARGYLNHPELTSEKFPHFHHSSFIMHHANLFRTGDLARYLPGGTIEFLGRLDHQVKVRGYRIETGEIEAILARHPAVRQNVVVTHADNTGEKRLTAYIVKNNTPAAGGAETGISAGRLRNFLKRQLPAYMTPAAYVFLDALPLTPNGKVDRRALPAPGTARPGPDRTFAAPRGRVEQLLIATWTQALGIDNIGIYDNFFDLGGASIQAIKVAHLANKGGLSLTPELIFQHQTVARLAEAVGDAPPGAGAGLGPGAENEPGDFSPDPNGLFELLPTAPDTAGKTNDPRTIIESLGVYIPPNAVSTQEVLRGCRKKMMFPLERMTGIKSRHMAGEGEFALDLARKAIIDCLAKSKYTPADIDLLICCNISRYDGPGQFSFEPNTSIKLRKHFGFDNALAFDIGNACTGMFTAIAIVDTFIKTGLAVRALVVSGEYITHLTGTAQKEIESFMDARLACLTVGDAGAALIMEKAAAGNAGLEKIDLYTVGRYSTLCIAKVTDQAHGGAIMYTDSLKQTAVSIKHAVRHSVNMLRQNNWPPGSFQHLIMHQTSETALRDAVRAINRLFGKEVCHEGNTVFNLAERGNTATTTHFVALKDNIINNRINSGDKVVFAVTGSGQTIGTALYTLDDLPDRLRRKEPVEKRPPGRRRETKKNIIPRPMDYRVRIESLGVVPMDWKFKRDAIELAKKAAEDCLKKSSHSREDIGLLVHAGLYRNDFLSEPALAALLAGELKLNDDIDPQAKNKTFAFDVFNGSMGFLNACYIATILLRTKRFDVVMITASEIENNAAILPFPGKLRGIMETGSAMILDKHGHHGQGFGNFVFNTHTDFITALTAYTGRENGKTYLQIDRDPSLEDYYLECIPGTVKELLDSEGLDISQVKAIFPPQISAAFIEKLSRKLGVAKDKFVCLSDEQQEQDGDYFTSSLVYTLEHSLRQEKVGPGDIGLIIGVGTGIQTGCAIYYF